MKTKVMQNISKIYGKGYKKMLIVVFLGSFCGSLAQLFYTYEIGVVIDLSNYKKIVINTIYICIAVLIRVLTSYINKIIIYKVNNKFAFRLRKMITRKICYSNYKELEAQDEKKILSILTTDGEGFKRWFNTLFALGEVPTKAGLCFAYTIYMFYTCWTLMDLVAILSLFILSLILNNILSKRIYSLTMQERENKGQVISYFVNSLNFRMMIKAYNLEKKFLNENKVKLNKLKKSERKSYIYGRIMNYYGAMNGYFNFLFVLGIGAKNIINGSLQLGQLVSAIFLMDIIGQGVTIIQAIPPNYQNVKASVDRVNSLLNLKESEDLIKSQVDPSNMDTDSNIYKLENVSFRYADTYVLNNISFNIHKGEKIAVVGKSGCGKTTLLKLLCNLYEPEEGTIEYMGNTITNISKKNYYEQIAVITQENFILDDTISNNVHIVAGNKDTNDVKKAIKKAQLNDFIIAQEHGIDTVIGTGNHMLSNGQNQRVNIARAFLKDSEVYLCDEPTSALDEDNTNKIMDVFFNDLKEKTLIVICHSGIDFNRFDRVLFLKDSRIAGYASHLELISNNKEYCEIFSQL